MMWVKYVADVVLCHVLCLLEVTIGVAHCLYCLLMELLHGASQDQGVGEVSCLLQGVDKLSQLAQHGN